MTWAARDRILQIRNKHLGRGLSLSYRSPLCLVRGQGQYLYDEHGKQYLDCVNNVCHVGHCHPHVVSAARQQMAALNTNTRYLYRPLADYLEALLARFPEPLSVCYLVCTGSEANDLALRLARTVTGAKDVIVVESAYHGTTQATIDVSAYKFDGPGGQGAPATTHKIPLPCSYRGIVAADHPAPGEAHASFVEAVLDRLEQEGKRPAAFLCESMLGVGGQIPLPDGYLPAIFERVRAAGGITIADEVQVGFGRVGSHFSAFELQGVVPDIVTLGKPMGNGHPLAAVITTPEIAAAFDNGMEYFNTFGGNPVSCAIGQAVLEVLEQERLQAHAERLGQSLLAGLREEFAGHPLVGDVRGRGLFLGIELVQDRQSKRPAKKAAHDLVEHMREDGILLSVDGPLHNVIKFKPPMVFADADADRLMNRLKRHLSPRRGSDRPVDPSSAEDEE